MKKVILGIGIPGSGKTTVLKELAEKNGYKYICPDDMRSEILGNATDQSKNQVIWEEAYRRTREALDQGETVVLDATFANSEQRKDFLKFARENGAEKIQGVFVDTPLEIARERNLGRDRKVPEDVLERMNENLQKFPPEIEDGLDSLFTLNENKELVSLDLDEGENVVQKEFKIR